MPIYRENIPIVAGDSLPAAPDEETTPVIRRFQGYSDQPEYTSLHQHWNVNQTKGQEPVIKHFQD